ncbi:hypothetical protein ATE84_2939 [Aquimarina sp. MAR_2010_214]|uniref:hypothetical protein n=1 Tax=Aquimarina sp. MAR_2010_214 TaxID=1250026 RepID=UPI000C7091B0|nr:hypothetical protein [Aquimarina sp. MAR_2010_214]PKV50871.1 hypothetical protein ATE84_2939 [Aquimarina sp. MAR_2010_214]
MREHLTKFYLSIAKEILSSDDYRLKLSKEAHDLFKSNIEDTLNAQDSEVLETPNWLSMTAKNTELFTHILALKHLVENNQSPQISLELFKEVKRVLCPNLPIC